MCTKENTFCIVRGTIGRIVLVVYEDKLSVVKTPVKKFLVISSLVIDPHDTFVFLLHCRSCLPPRVVTPTSVEHNASKGSGDIAVQGFAKQRNAFYYPCEPVFLTNFRRIFKEYSLSLFFNNLTLLTVLLNYVERRF